MQKSKNGENKIRMGKLLQFPGSHPKKPMPEIIPQTSLVSCAEDLLDHNLRLIGTFLGGENMLQGRKKPEIVFIDGVDPADDADDGSMQVLWGATSKTSTVVCTNNVKEFFGRNNANNADTSTDSATLYATSLGIAALALGSRGVALPRMGFNERLWGYFRIGEPRVVAPYRFAASVLNHTGLAIEQEGLVVKGKALTAHAASFKNPLTKSHSRDLASSYFKSH